MAHGHPRRSLDRHSCVDGPFKYGDRPDGTARDAFPRQTRSLKRGIDRGRRVDERAERGAASERRRDAEEARAIRRPDSTQPSRATGGAGVDLCPAGGARREFRDRQHVWQQWGDGAAVGIVASHRCRHCWVIDASSATPHVIPVVWCLCAPFVKRATVGIQREPRTGGTRPAVARHGSGALWLLPVPGASRCRVRGEAITMRDALGGR